MTPKLSIITVNLNNVKGLEQTLQSVSSQTFADLEHIVIDGGSTDGSKDFLEKNNSKFSYWVSEQDGGIYQGMNKGIARANGQYLLFLNSGDYLANNCILEKFFANTFDQDIVYGNNIIRFPNGKIELRKFPKETELSSAYFYRKFLPHQSTMFKADIFKKFGSYRTDLGLVADWAFYINAIYLHGASIKHIPITLSIFSVDGASVQRQNRIAMEENRKKVWQEYFPYMHKDIARLAVFEKMLKIPGLKIFYRLIEKYKIIYKLIDKCEDFIANILWLAKFEYKRKQCYNPLNFEEK
jgi:glycosyltransferase involved in cell wall biosynthesis